MIILDTNVVSELRKGRRADPHVVDWLAQFDEATQYLSVVTVLELEIGVRRMERRDPEQGRKLRAWLDTQVLPAFEGRILPFDTPVARRCATLHVPDPRPDRDAMIAATAMVHDLTLATRNIRDFDGTGVKLVDPWAERGQV